MAYERNDYGRGPYGQGPSYGRGGDYTSDRYRERVYGNVSGNRFRSDRDDDRWGRDDDGDDRGFFDRAGDEVRSWFGDEDAQRRRERDMRDDDDGYRRNRAPQHDPNYHDWRRRQIESLDRDYADYRREHQSRFDSEFGGWRSNRQTQRSSLDRVEEHMEVVGSDGEHIGTVDKVRGDRIVLTKGDREAGGHHHSIPSSWISTVDDKVTITKSAIEAKSAWRDEERNGALFGHETEDSRGSRVLNRAFSGTY